MRAGRFILFVAFALLAAGLPGCAGLAAAISGSGPYQVDAGRMQAAGGRFLSPEAVVGQGGRVTMAGAGGGDGEGAVAGATAGTGGGAGAGASRPEAVPTLSADFPDGTKVEITAGGAGGTLYSVSVAPGRTEVAVAAGRYRFRVTAPDYDTAMARLAALPALSPTTGGIWGLMRSGWLGWLGAGVAFYYLLLVPPFSRLASWASTVPAAPAAVAATEAQLRQRLLDLNQAGVPFAVRATGRPDELVVEWRYVDARWVGLLATAGARRLHRLVLRVDAASHRVRARDEHAELRWEAGADGPRLRAQLQWHAFKGITFFQFQAGAEYGIYRRDGRWVLGPAYKYHFSLAELKTPVVAVITESGWDYRPVITFHRLLSG